MRKTRCVKEKVRRKKLVRGKKVSEEEDCEGRGKKVSML